MKRPLALVALSVLAAAVGACGQTTDSEGQASASAEPTANQPSPVPPEFSCEPSTVPGELSLTGAWLGDDGGIYYITQLGRPPIVWWNGMGLTGTDESTLGKEWNNVFHGIYNRNQNTISGDWADVPRGGEMNAGHLVLAVGIDDVLRVVEQTDAHGDPGGVFGARSFIRCYEFRVPLNPTPSASAAALSCTDAFIART